MRRTAVIAGAAGAVIVLGGGIALAFDGEGASPTSADRTAVTSPASPEPEPGTPTDDPSTTPSPSPSAPSTAPSAPAAPTAIGRAAAERIALRTVPGGRIESVEREIEHGRAVWDIDVIAGGVEHDVEIDAQTGKVLRYRTDDGGEGRDDSGHDDHDDKGHGRGHDDGGHDDH